MCLLSILFLRNTEILDKIILVKKYWRFWRQFHHYHFDCSYFLIDTLSVGRGQRGISLAWSRQGDISPAARFSKYWSCPGTPGWRVHCHQLLMAESRVPVSPSLVASPPAPLIRETQHSFRSFFVYLLHKYQTKGASCASIRLNIINRVNEGPHYHGYSRPQVTNVRIIVALWSWQCLQKGVIHIFMDMWFIHQNRAYNSWAILELQKIKLLSPLPQINCSNKCPTYLAH